MQDGLLWQTQRNLKPCFQSSTCLQLFCPECSEAGVGFTHPTARRGINPQALDHLCECKIELAP